MTKFTNLFLKLFICIVLCSTFSDSYAKNYSARDIYGRRINFSIPSNKWIIINYWATWCGACVEEIPELNKLAASLVNKPVVFLAANYENLPSAQLRAFAARFGMAYPITRYNPIENLISLESISSIPVTVVISPKGKMNVLQGSQSMSDILQALV